MDSKSCYCSPCYGEQQFWMLLFMIFLNEPKLRQTKGFQDSGYHSFWLAQSCPLDMFSCFINNILSIVFFFLLHHDVMNLTLTHRKGVWIGWASITLTLFLYVVHNMALALSHKEATASHRQMRITFEAKHETNRTRDSMIVGNMWTLVKQIWETLGSSR